MAHAQTSKFTLYTLLLALFVLVACGNTANININNNNLPPSGVDCTVRGNSFDAACTSNETAVATRLELCSGKIADLTAAGGSAAACKTTALSGTICGTGSITGTNPHAPICSQPEAVLEGFDLTLAQTMFNNACKTFPFTRGCANAPDNELSVTTYCTPDKFFREGCSVEVNVDCTAEGVCTPNSAYLARLASRLNACTSYAGDPAALMAADGTVASCDSPELAGVICGTATSVGTNPFAAICSEATGNSDSANIEDRQLAYCSENRTTDTCPMVISTFCATADGAKSQSLCPTQYTLATTVPAIVTAVASKSKARNIADTAEATILDEITGGAYTSYVDAIAGTAVGGITRPTFNFGGAAHGVGGVSIIQEGLLLSELVFQESDDDSEITDVASDAGTELASIGTTDGFAIARVDNPAFTDNPNGSIDTRARFYAGLLTTTDLGAPLTDRSADGIWTAEFVAIVSDSNSDGRTGRRIATRSTLRVSFADKTIQTREVGGRFTPLPSNAPLNAEKPSNPTDFYDGISTENNDAGRPYNIAGSRITINGRFNAEGVISGASSWIYDGKTSRGSVSGLIGLKGAVGAFVSNGRNNGEDSNGEYAGGFVASNECAIIPFHASCADEYFDGLRAARIGYCADGTQSTNPLCMHADVLAITNICTPNPFAAECAPYEKQYETVRNTRLAVCSGANHATADCTSAKATVCDHNYYPFAPLCDNNSTQQSLYCQNTNPFDKTNCTAVTVEAQRTFCGNNNPRIIDVTNNVHSYPHAECALTIQAFCGTPTNPTYVQANLFDSNNLCGESDFNAARGRACLDGYVDSTTGQRPARCGYENNVGKDVYIYCESVGFRNVKECPTAYARNNPAVSSVSLADFTRTGKNQPLNSDGTAPLTTIVASGGASLADTDSNLITGGADSLDLGLADNKTSGHGIVRLSRIGDHHDSDSGFATAGGFIDNGGTDVYKQYVGLLSGTDLGAPLSDDAHSGRWDARVFIRVSVSEAGNRNVPIHQHFKLDVNFRAKTLASFYTRNDGGGSILYFNDSDSESLVHPQFRIVKGKFTDNGVIYGTVRLYAGNSNSLGTLTGLIGQGGAVGIFASTDNRQADYVGGFVAAPSLLIQDFTKWENSFDANGVNEDKTLRSGGSPSSLRSSADFIKLDRTDQIFIHGTALDTTVLRMNETLGRDGYKSGFGYAYHTATASTGDPLTQAYAGLLLGTNVGAPLSSTPYLVYWDGKIAGTFGGTEFSDDTFRIHVNYNSGSQAGTIKTVRDGTSFDGRTYLITGPVSGRDNSTNSINISGRFDSNGVMYGNVDFNGVDGLLANSSGGGTFSGLIGQRGAVGVFKGLVVTHTPTNSDPTARTSIPYAGGFIVDNPN